MERAPILVSVAVIAVIAGVGIKILSDRTVIDTGDRPDDVAAVDREAGSGAGGGAGSASESSGRGAASESGPGHRPGERSSSSRSLDGSRSLAGGGDFSGGGAVEGGRRIEGRRGNAIGDSRDPGGHRARSNSEIADFLGSRSAKSSSDSADPSSDVALEVLNEADSSKAAHTEGVYEPDDGGEGLKFSDDAQMTFSEAGGANGEAGTISFDVEPDWAGGDKTDNSLVQIRAENQWENRLQLVKNGRYLRFILSDSLGREADISVPIDGWVPGETHSVTASWGDGRTSLFLDGALAGSNTYDGQFNIAPDTPLYLGSDFLSSDYGSAKATIRGFTVFKTAQHP
jgi:hypothetical protein